MITIIKKGVILASRQQALPYDDELAIAQFRAFYATANLHTKRVQSIYAKNVMKEVLETLLSDLNAPIKSD